MRTNSATLLVAFAIAVQHAVATGWVDFKSFSSPSNTDNRCNNDQQSGFDWNGLSTGDFGTYGEFDFSGFKCADSFRDKRDLAPRNFQSKCIKGAVNKNAPSAPKISGGSGKRFSIKDLQISSSEDTELDLVYSYENGDVCRQTAACSKGGSTIENSQCGGAIAVTFQLPAHVEQTECEVGIHSVGFDCGPPSTGPQSPPATSGPASTLSAALSTSSLPASIPSLSITYSIPKGNFSTPAEFGTAPVTTRVDVPGTIPASSAGTSPVTIPLTTGGNPPPASSTPGPNSVDSNSEASTPAVSAPFTTVPVASSLSSPPTELDTSSASGSTQAVVTTVNVYTTLTTCPVTNTVTSGTKEIVESSFTISTIVKTAVSTICTKCIAPQSSTLTPSTETSTPPVVSGSVSSVSSSPDVSIPVTSAFPSPSESSASAPLPSSPASTEDVVTTVIIRTTVTTCPVTNTVTSGTSQIIQTSKKVSTIFNTITSTICTKCIAPPATPLSSTLDASTAETSPASVPAPPPVSTAPAPAPPVPAPSILPKCLNTWITLTACANNADSDCYCKDSTFTKNVQDCVSSWTEDSSLIQAALSYFVGICAPHVPENPGIITNVPETITLIPLPSATGDLVTASGNPSPPTSAPVTTITIVQTVTVPCTYSAGVSAGQPIPSSSTISLLSTEVTVPQVQFTTQKPTGGATESPSVVLAAGSPAPAPAVPTAIAPPGPAGVTGGTTFATGVLPSGQRPPANTSLAPFTGAAGRMDTSTMGAVMMGLLGVFGVMGI